MKKQFLIILICGYIFNAEAQGVAAVKMTTKDSLNKSSSGYVKPVKTTYIMPDGKILAGDKLDSVIKAWGGEFSMRHSEDDDSKGIMHLIRPTAVMKQQQAEATANRAKVLASMINQPAPDFELSDMTSKKYALASLKGKVVVLNFWFTSCPPCIQEMPKLNELVKMYDPEKVVFLALTFNDAKQVASFLKVHAFEYKLLTGSKKIDEQYHIGSWPTSLVINKSGVITKATISSPDIKKELATAIDANL